MGWRNRTVAALATALPLAPVAAQAPQVAPRLPPLPPAVIDDTLAIEGDDLAARKVASRMTVPVAVNGRGPFPFLVDSGADTSVVGARVAQALQLPAGAPVMLHAMTGSGPVARVAVDTLGLGRSAAHDLLLPVLREADLGGAGILGIDALAQQRLMLDFERRTIRVEDAALRARRLDGEIVVTARRRRGQLILTQVRANATPVEAVVDTGSEVTIGNIALRDRLVRHGRDRVTNGTITDVAGRTMAVQLARIAELRLGSVVLRNVPIAFADVPPFAVFGLADGPALLLGTDLMETFRRVSLDFRARKVRFQLRRCQREFVTVRMQSGVDTQLGLTNGSTVACAR